MKWPCGGDASSRELRASNRRPHHHHHLARGQNGLLPCRLLACAERNLAAPTLPSAERRRRKPPATEPSRWPRGDEWLENGQRRDEAYRRET